MAAQASGIMLPCLLLLGTARQFAVGSLLDRLPGAAPVTNISLDLSSSSCVITPAMMTVTPPRPYRHLCEPVEVMTFGCRGTCPSYVRVREDHPERMNRVCRCCEPTRYGVHLATMQCSDGTELRAAIKFARECTCRKCDALETITDESLLLEAARKENVFLSGSEN